MNVLTRRQMLKAMATAAGAVTVGTTTAQLAGAAPGTEIRVLAINTWLNGTSVSGGLQMVADIVTATRANVVILTESNNSATNSVATRLTNAGTKFYAASTSDTGIISQFPISGATSLSWMTKAIITVGGIEIATYAAHLNYKYYATYLPRGYGAGNDSGEFSGWNKLPGGPVTDLAKIQLNNNNSGRPATITSFINDAAVEQSKGRSILLGGDFNEPSALDWTDGTKNMFDHNGVVIPWETTRRLQAAGFIDSYRSKYPNPVTHPGATWPSDNPAKSPSDISWAPAADERDRIDYIFTDSASKLSLTETGIVGPRSTIVRNQRVAETSQDNFIYSPAQWPTDHKAMLSVYQINTGAATTTTTVEAPDSAKKGAAVTLTANVTPAAPGGTVQFLDGATPLGDPATVTNGTASITRTFDTNGDHAITAVFSGTTGFLESTSEIKTITVSTDNIVTTTTVEAPDSAKKGAAVTLTANIAPAAPGGTVQFLDGATPLGAPATVENGTASITHTFDTNGDHTITAVFSGTTGILGSTSEIKTITVSTDNIVTTTTMTAPDSAFVGQAVNLHATVSPAVLGGTVEFTVDGNDKVTGPLGTDGTAVASYTFTTAGPHSVVARYSGTQGVAGSLAPTFPISVAVVQPANVQTTTTLAPIGTVAKGAPVTLKATVNPANANGKVQFKIGDTPLGGRVTVSNGVATLPATFAASGTFSVTAEFIGAAGFVDSSSTPQTLTVPGDPDPGTNPGTGGIFGSLGNLGNLGNLFGS
ncbi:Ig-like domain repeat protein [Rhodococcus sp. OK302]|uniref:Ig-like domain repeat protein n=1 Tax=Rhodococcus sp. OK302 TaxID=1882769 RepID=UPI0020CC00BD|nr:Ig-like domain repeat protein [Rhodococcus sp. OK302]